MISFTQGKSKQQGIVLAGATFLLIVIALVISFAITVAASTKITADLNIQTTRAYDAAVVGAGIALSQVVEQGLDCQTVVNNSSIDLSGSLSDFRVLISCTQSGPFFEEANTFEVYTVDATAIFKNATIDESPLYSSRDYQIKIIHEL